MEFQMPYKAVKSRQQLGHEGLRMLAMDGIAAIPDIQTLFYRHKLPFHWTNLMQHMVKIGDQDDLGYLIIASDRCLEDAAHLALKRLIED